MVTTELTTEELLALVAAQRPIEPKGAALAFIIVSAICWLLSFTAIALRVYARAFWRRIWGWDDTFAVLGMVAFTIALAYAVLSSIYGLGTPDADVILPLAVTGIYYNKWWEVAYCFSISFTRTSIGVAILRIAVEKAHRIACWGLVVVSNACYIAGVIWATAHCSPAAYPWNVLEGTCAGDSIIIPLTYVIMITAAFCDAGFALVPFLVVRNLQMRPDLKYTLMVVMAMGSLAAFSSVARLPWVHYMPARLGTMYQNVYMPILSMVENMIGLVFGSLPAIGKMLRLFDRPATSKRSYPTDQRMGNHTLGGTPFAPLGKGTELDSLELIPRGKGESQTRIWSEYNTVASSALNTIDEPELKAKSKSRFH